MWGQHNPINQLQQDDHNSDIIKVMKKDFAAEDFYERKKSQNKKQAATPCPYPLI